MAHLHIHVARRGVRKPEIIIARSAHAAYYKAAEYFKMKMVMLPVDKDYRLSGVRHVTCNLCVWCWRARVSVYASVRACLTGCFTTAGGWPSLSSCTHTRCCCPWALCYDKRGELQTCRGGGRCRACSPCSMSFSQFPHPGEGHPPILSPCAGAAVRCALTGSTCRRGGRCHAFCPESPHLPSSRRGGGASRADQQHGSCDRVCAGVPAWRGGQHRRHCTRESPQRVGVRGVIRRMDMHLMSTHTHTHTHTHTCAHTHVHMHARTHAHMHTHMHTYTHAHTHILTHTCTHTHAHTHAHAPPGLPAQGCLAARGRVPGRLCAAVRPEAGPPRPPL